MNSAWLVLYGLRDWLALLSRNYTANRTGMVARRLRGTDSMNRNLAN